MGAEQSNTNLREFPDESARVPDARVYLRDYILDDMNWFSVTLPNLLPLFKNTLVTFPTATYYLQQILDGINKLYRMDDYNPDADEVAIWEYAIAQLNMAIAASNDKNWHHTPGPESVELPNIETASFQGTKLWLAHQLVDAWNIIQEAIAVECAPKKKCVWPIRAKGTGNQSLI